jgi:hypothetical protein
MADLRKTPLNGTKTHPLSQAALTVLLLLEEAPVPCSKVNPGIINRLDREDLAEVVDLPSPFRAHRGGTCPHLQITQAGRDLLLSKRPL